MSIRSWLEEDRRRSYNELYGHLSIVMESGSTRIQIPYVELLTCSKKRLAEITKLAVKYGGWKLIDHTKEKTYE